MTLMCCGEPALAYRPFDSTDADVAAPGEFELELAPVGYFWEKRDRQLIAPAFVANFGFARDWEVVMEGRRLASVGAGPSQSRFVDDQVSIKGILRRGSLQEEPGPSIATELSVLLPEAHGTPAAGISGAAIVSQRFSWGTVHFNSKLALTRDHDAELFFGAILEGPSTWKIRPVAEVFYERDFGSGHEVSGLIGAIWQIRDNLALDLGYRHGWTDTAQSHEVRLGLTFSLQIL